MSRLSTFLSFVEREDHAADQDQSLQKQHVDAFTNAPIFTTAVKKFIHSHHGLATDPIPQYGLIGIREDLPGMGASEEDRLVFSNMNMPWSAFICGSQGAGKSHTLSCLLENALVGNNPAGELPNPLAGLVMHYDKSASHTASQVCEAAYLCSSGIRVTVLVSPSNIWAMKRLYSNLPGLKPGMLKVLPLYLDEDRLDVNMMSKLMAVDPAAEKTPLYMEVVVKIAREMAMEGPTFTYAEFRRRLAEVKWVPGQETSLNLRLQLVDSIIAPSPTTKTTRPAQAQENIWEFSPGSLTIIDLSDPFIGSNDACTLFSICLSIFLNERNKCGRVVVLDEAHKFLSQSGEAKILTDELLSIIRQQRHTGTRVFIATQEPTLSPKLVELANTTFVHRFTSPNWYETLKKYLAGANRQDSGQGNSLFDTIVALRTGEALLFCPTAQMDIDDTPGYPQQYMKALGSGYVKVRIRKRLTTDGGKSIMATDASTKAFTNKTASGPLMDDVPMHVVNSKQNKNNPPAKTAKPAASQAALDSAATTMNNGHTGSAQPTAATPAAPKANGPHHSTPNKTQATATPPVLSPKTAANASIMRGREKIKAELIREAEAFFVVNWTRFGGTMTKAQRETIAARVEATLKITPGTLKTNEFFLECAYDVDRYLAECKKRNRK